MGIRDAGLEGLEGLELITDRELLVDETSLDIMCARNLHHGQNQCGCTRPGITGGLGPGFDPNVAVSPEIEDMIRVKPLADG